MIQIEARPAEAVPGNASPPDASDVSPTGAPFTPTTATTATATATTTTTTTEAWLAQLWTELLAQPGIDSNDDFLTRSGRDPYDVVRLLSRLRAAGHAVRAADIVTHSRLGDLAALLGGRPQADRPVTPALATSPPPQPVILEAATAPFRFTPDSRSDQQSTPGLRLEPDLMATLARITGQSGFDLAALFHAGLALALSRSSGQSAVGFATSVATGWQPLALDLATTSAATLVTSLANQLTGLSLSASLPAAAQTPLAAAIDGPIVGLHVEAAVAASGPQGEQRLAGSSRASAPPVLVSAIESSDGWWLAARGAASAEPGRLVDYLASALTCLAGVLADDDACPPALALDILPRAEREQLARFAQGPESPYRHGRAIAPWFVEQARLTPAATALIFGDERLSYAELDARSNRLAAWLRECGASRGSRIGLCVARSVEMVVAQLAILKLGAAYVPLDPSFPVDRLAFMAEDAELALLVSDSSASPPLAWPSERTVDLSQDRRAINAISAAPIVVAIEADDPAYVIYTSGSTGKPKGVVVTNGNVANFIGASYLRPGLTASDRLLAVTTLSFDIHVLELLAPLCVGATIVLADSNQTTSGSALQALIETHDVTLLQATPSTWSLLIDAGWPGTPSLIALIGGEPLSPEMASQLLARTRALWNMYGPTEATVWSHCCRITSATTEISIGTPLANLSGRVVDAAGRACPVGVAGELWIGGDGVAAGYWRRPDLTRDRFLADPDAPHPGGRVYRTGDLVTWLADGSLRHLGRMDQQVKVRGHRIELGEIESALEARDDISQCVCLVRKDPAGEARLVAYVRGRGADDHQALLAHARQSLPDYMVPQHVVALERLPLLPNGKIDRKALPDPEWALRTQAVSEAPLGPVEEGLARIWAEVLKVDSIGRRDNFFDLGGHSLAAMRVLSRIEKTFDRKLRVVSLFEAPTLEAQARLIDPSIAVTTRPAPAVVPIQASGRRPPIFFVSGYGGPILLLQNLARELGANQPLYLLDFAALDQDAQTATIEAAARALVEQMRLRQPVGPYHLAGYSLGAPIVYEMGQQLLAAGEDVPMLAMLDRFAPGHPRPPAFARRVVLHLREALARGPRAALPYLAHFTRRFGRRLASGLGLPVSPHLPGEDLELLELNLDSATRRLSVASDHYVFQPYDGPLMFIRVADLGDHGIGTIEDDPVGGWHELAPLARPIGVVPGIHTTLLFPENARLVAGLLTRCVALAGNQRSGGPDDGPDDGAAPVPRRPASSTSASTSSAAADIGA